MLAMKHRSIERQLVPPFFVAVSWSASTVSRHSHDMQVAWSTMVP
jgi:hypothetical protein